MKDSRGSGFVYPPREDSELLLPFADVPGGTLLAEVGCGRGIAALRAASHGARVVATDLNPFALRAVRREAGSRRLALDCVRTDLLQGLRTFDRILFNPPYLPTHPGVRDPDRWHSLAVDGGVEGLDTFVRFVEMLSDHLRPRGSAFVVVSSRQDVVGRNRILQGWRRSGGDVDTVAARRLGEERLEVVRLGATGSTQT